MIEQWLSTPDVRFVLQPIISLSSAQTIGYELLSRPIADGRELPVESFFQTASEQGAAVAVDRHLINRITKFLNERSIPAPAFVNLHPDSLTDPYIQARIVPLAHMVVIEVTERVDWNFAELESFLREWQQRGGMFALDDFGSGYSGLEKLVTIHPDYVKLDARLVRGADQNHVKQKVMEAVSQLSSFLSFKLLAEGIETEGELETCLTRGVTIGQGFYFCRPLPWDQHPQVDPAIKHHILQRYQWIQRSKAAPQTIGPDWAYHAAVLADLQLTPGDQARADLISAALYRVLRPHSVTVLVADNEGLRPWVSHGHAHRHMMPWSSPSLARDAFQHVRVEVRQTSGDNGDSNGLTGELNHLLGSPQSVAICPVGHPPWGLIGADYLQPYAWSEERLNVLHTYARLMSLVVSPKREAPLNIRANPAD